MLKSIGQILHRTLYTTTLQLLTYPCLSKNCVHKRVPRQPPHSTIILNTHSKTTSRSSSLHYWDTPWEFPLHSSTIAACVVPNVGEQVSERSFSNIFTHQHIFKCFQSKLIMNQTILRVPPPIPLS